MYNSDFWCQSTRLKDYGPEPFVINIDEATKQNNTFRTALWTGDNLQVTLMSIEVGSDIGLEVHTIGDQLDFQQKVSDDYAIMIPAGKWHHIINTGNTLSIHHLSIHMVRFIKLKQMQKLLKGFRDINLLSFLSIF